jgi:hypothetical protein
VRGPKFNFQMRIRENTDAYIKPMKFIFVEDPIPFDFDPPLGSNCCKIQVNPA